MRFNPRDYIVTEADLAIREELSATLKLLHIPWVDILYHVAIIKVFLLGEMGATVGPSVPVENIPDNQHVLSTCFYRYMLEFDLTSAELYRIITMWELKEAYGMVKAERETLEG